MDGLISDSLTTFGRDAHRRITEAFGNVGVRACLGRQSGYFSLRR